MSRDGVEHRVVKVSLITGFSTLLSIGFQLVSVSICLKYWGKESYGSWLALYAAFMLIRSIDGGFVSYVGNKLNYLYHQDHNVLRQHLASGLIGVSIIGVLQFSISSLAIFSNEFESLLGIASVKDADHRSSLALLILTVTWVLSGGYLGIVHRLLIPAGMMYQAAWWSMGFQISQFFGIILAAILHFDMLQTSILFSILQFSIYLASAIYIKKKLPAFYPWWRGNRLHTAIKDLGRSMFLTASNLVQQGTNNGIVILVSLLSGPAAVPIFTTIRTLTNLWTSFTNVLTTPLLPEVVRYHATGKGAKIVTICEVHWVLVGSAINLGILITYPIIEPIYVYWTAHMVPLDQTLLCLLLSSIIVANVGALITLYLNGINSLRVVLVASVMRCTFSLVGGGLLFYHFGLLGFGMGILGGELLALFAMSYYFVQRELFLLDVCLPLRSIAPITISTALVLLFLVTQGFGFPFGKYVYAVALLGAATAGLWGWNGLESALRARLVQMVRDRFFRGVFS